MALCETSFDPKTKIWSGRDAEPLFNPKISVGQAILHMLSSNPKNIAQISDNNGVTLTNEDIKLRSIRIAQHLLKSGFKQGDVMGVVCKSTENLAAVIIAGFICGLPVNTLDPSLNRGNFGITKPKIIFCDHDYYDRVLNNIKNLNLNAVFYIVDGKVDGVPCVEHLLEETMNEKYFISPKLIDPESNPAAILFSSGTTGPSKAIALAHGQFLQRTWMSYDDDYCLALSAMHWIAGFDQLITSILSGGKRVITAEEITPELVLRLIEKYQTKVFFANTAMVRKLLECSDIEFRDISSIRMFLTGGSKISKKDNLDLMKHLKGGQLINCYGMTELAHCPALDCPRTETGSTGKLTPGSKVKIVDDNGELLGIGEDGELFVQTPHKFLGYFESGKPISNILDKDDYMPTGDIGHFDENGYLYIVDRKKDIFKFDTFAVNPSKIEDCILELPGVKQVCVFDVPDERERLLPTAAIIKAPYSKLTENHVYDHVAKNLSEFEKLRGGVYFVETLPTTVTGKVQRRKMKQVISKYDQMLVHGCRNEKNL